MRRSACELSRVPMSDYCMYGSMHGGLDDATEAAIGWQPGDGRTPVGIPSKNITRTISGMRKRTNTYKYAELS